jgi:hypothetical protein
MYPNQEHLKIISNCPVCNSRNFPAKVKVLSEKNESHILHIQCRKCKSCLIVLITASPQGMMSMGVLTDLRSDEVVKFSQSKPLSEDDVLDLYQSCRNNALTFLG